MGLILLAVVTFAAVLVLGQALILGIGPVPTSRAVRQALLELVPAQTEGEIHELGAGWGGLAIALAERCPQAKVIAWERSVVPFAVLSLRCVLGPPNVSARFGTIYAVDLRKAHGVVCFLFVEAMRRLKPRFDEQLGADAWVVTHLFAVPGWRAEQTSQVSDLYRTPVYRYRRGSQS